MTNQNSNIVSKNNKRLAKNTIILYVRMLFVMFITLFTTRELLSALGVEDYGLYNVVCGFVNMFAFLNSSMANGIQRFYNYEIGKNGEKGIGTVFTHALIIQLGIALVIFLIAETFGLWYLYNKMIIPEGRFIAAFWIFQFAMFQMFLNVIAVPYSAAVMAYERMNFYAIVGIIDAALKLFITYAICYFLFDKLILYGALMSLICIFNLLLNYVYCKRQFSYLKCTKGFNIRLFKDMLSFSGWNFFGSFAHMMESQGINLIYNAFWGTIVNAANGIASQVNAAIRSLTTGFVTAVRPQMIKSYACGNIDYLLKMYYSASKLTFYLIMLLAVPMIGEIGVILDFWLGPGKYPDMTPMFCKLSMIIALCNSYATPTSIIAHATGKMKKFQVVVSFTILLVIPLAYVFAKIGCNPFVILILGAFINIIAQIVRLFIIREQVGFPISDYVKNVFIPTWFVFALSILFTYIVNYFIPSQIIYSILSIGISVVFSIICILCFGLSKTERRLAISLVKSKIK